MLEVAYRDIPAIEVMLHLGSYDEMPMNDLMSSVVHLRIFARNLEILGIRDETMFDMATKFLPVAVGVLSVALRSYALYFLAAAIMPWWVCMTRLRDARQLTATSKRIDALATAVEAVFARRRTSGEVVDTSKVRVDSEAAVAMDGEPREEQNPAVKARKS